MADREPIVRGETLVTDRVTATDASAQFVEPHMFVAAEIATDVVEDSVETRESGERLAARAAWMMAAKALAFVFSFALPLLLARRMDTFEFGLYKQFTLLVGTALTLLPLGVGVSAFYFLARVRERRHQIVFNILIFHLSVAGAACLVLILRPQLLSRLLGSAEMTVYAPLIGVVVLLWVGSAFLEFVAVANGEMKLGTTFVVATQFSKAACLLTAALTFGTVRAIIYAAIIHGGLQMLLALWYLQSRFSDLWRGFEWQTLRAQLAYAIPLGLASMIFQTLLILDSYFVSYRFGAAGYAIYAVGCFQLPLVALLSESVASVTIPRVSFLQKHGRRDEIVELIARLVRKLALVYFPLYAFLLLAGREFLLVLFTAKFAASWPIFMVNLTLIPLAILASAYDPVMRAYAQHRYFLLRVRVLMLVLLAAGLWFATERFGLMGAITTMVAINGVERLVTALKIKSILGIGARDVSRFKDISKVGVAAAFAAFVTWAVRASTLGTSVFITLAASAFVFVLAYAVAVYVLNILTPEERAMIRRQFTQWPGHGYRRRVAPSI